MSVRGQMGDIWWMKNNIPQFEVQGSSIIKSPLRLTVRLEADCDCGHDV